MAEPKEQSDDAQTRRARPDAPEPPTAEERRLDDAREGRAHWRRWGPYVSERQWGTVREDYSADGAAWEYLPHDHARSRAYRWGEDGIAGISDDRQRLCFALALWNGADPILKERMFGLSGHEGNHGEDVKECYFYLDNVPSHAYMRMLYKYPQRAFPYAELVAEARRRTRNDPEYELLDTSVFDDDRYFDMFVEYAKADPDDILVRISIANRGPEAARVHVLPTLWFRNDWSWFPSEPKPSIVIERSGPDGVVLAAKHRDHDTFHLYCETPQRLLFTENETNNQRLFGSPNATPYVKDAFHAFVVEGRTDAVNPALFGTKAAAYYVRDIDAGETAVIRLRLARGGKLEQALGAAFDRVFAQRREEADAFYRRVTPFEMPDDMRNVQRQAFAGLLWTKQYYRYYVHRWLEGDPAGPAPPPERCNGRNHSWPHFAAGDVLSMPDKWEYPWFAAWDSAFHAVAFALIDPDFAKDQLIVLLREWYMHPNGQIPAYEWKFDDVNPPVHAWAAIRIYQIEGKLYGRHDRDFLERVFQKLLLNFTWWVNRKDSEGNNIFQGGFLGLDNIGAFDRSEALPGGGELEQADGTSWMAMYCLNMLAIALELARDDSVYQDIATKFFEHFVYIGAAVNRIGGEQGLWSEADGYYFDRLKLPDGRSFPISAYTIAGVVPVLAVAVADADVMRGFREFTERANWFARYRPELLRGLADIMHHGRENRARLALCDSGRLRRILAHVLDESSLLSPHGVRSLSMQHAANPFVLQLDGSRFTIDYAPAEATTPMFGGNSNWRGPVWMPINFLLIEALQKHDYFHGDDFKVESPTGSGNEATLWQVTTDLSYRLISLFLRNETGSRPIHGKRTKFATDPYFRDLVVFPEYFNGDTGEGLGATYQCGWTALVAKLIQQHAEYALRGKHHDLGDTSVLGLRRSLG